MPIGKNAIKRVVNNGYSAVKTSAPDMENSVIAEKKPEPKKTPAKNPVPKAVTSKKGTSSSHVNPAPKAAVMIEGIQKVQKPVSKKKAAAEATEIKTEKKEAPAVLPKTEEIKPLEVEKSPAPQTAVKIEPEVKKEPVSVPKKSMETEPELAPVRTLEKITENSERSGEGYINLGGSLPYYLL